MFNVHIQSKHRYGPSSVPLSGTGKLSSAHFFLSLFIAHFLSVAEQKGGGGGEAAAWWYLYRGSISLVNVFLLHQ